MLSLGLRNIIPQVTACTFVHKRTVDYYRRNGSHVFAGFIDFNKAFDSVDYYGRTLSDASMLYFADVFFIFFMTALVGQTAERIFTKLSHVVDIRCYLRTY